MDDSAFRDIIIHIYVSPDRRSQIYNNSTTAIRKTKSFIYWLLKQWRKTLVNNPWWLAFVSGFKFMMARVLYDSRWPYFFFIFFLILFPNVHRHASPINRRVSHCQSDRCGEERFFYINLFSSLYSWSIFHNDCNLCF